ncbi:hypothetical protein LR48_Vigan09g182400 [Vigna angularis]|uniref:Serine-threonine/tyrosine-protein kinase catalytic domain-containing protein n=1 Tax=Phaseolus angularis TaxID=3914 RepID=A0A0L9VDN1_PHAAN|nr:hypothetical protein LR48_Vigan09g182400 [Vigna angularis]
MACFAVMLRQCDIVIRYMVSWVNWIYAMHGYLTDKADVNSFGIVVLKIINGRNNIIHRQNEESFSILDWAHMLKEKGDLMELVDRRLVQTSRKMSPTMSSVVSILEGKSVVDEVVTEASEVLDEKRMEAMRKYYSELSIEVPWTASSTFASDLYPTHLDSHKRMLEMDISIILNF